jgi:hypothetical protein
VTCVVSVSAWRYTHRFTATTVKVSAFVGGVRNSKAFAWPIRVWMVNRLVGSFVVRAFSGAGFRKWQGPLRHQWPLPGPFLDVKAKLPGELSRLRRGYHEGKTSPANHDELRRISILRTPLNNTKSF